MLVVLAEKLEKGGRMIGATTEGREDKGEGRVTELQTNMNEFRCCQKRNNIFCLVKRNWQPVSEGGCSLMEWPWSWMIFVLTNFRDKSFLCENDFTSCTCFNCSADFVCCWPDLPLELLIVHVLISVLPAVSHLPSSISSSSCAFSLISHRVWSHSFLLVVGFFADKGFYLKFSHLS